MVFHGCPSLHFEFRARDECRRLQWGDIVVDDHPGSGKQALVWRAERGSKTRQGDGHCRAVSPKDHSTNTESCPVRVHLKYASHCPDEMKKPGFPFFLAVNHSPVPKLSFLPARYRGWTRAGERRVQDNLHAHAQNAAIPPQATISASRFLKNMSIN